MAFAGANGDILSFFQLRELSMKMGAVWEGYKIIASEAAERARELRILGQKLPSKELR